MKAAELRSKSIEELKQILSERLRMKFKIRLMKGSGELTYTHTLRDVTRTIARIKTLLLQKTRGESHVRSNEVKTNE